MSESENGIQTPSSLFNLEGRTAIVTGASGGLGRRFAEVLHGAGATVVVGARRAVALDTLADSLGSRVVTVPGDVTEPATREALAVAALDAGGSIDILVNNAGVGEPMPAEDEPLDAFRWTFDVNVDSLFALSQICGRRMLEQQKGSIINISSILGLVASAPITQAAYCASKGAVVNLTREMGAQWARRGVRVNSIAPGWFPSDMTTETMFETESGRQFIKRNCPMGRPGNPDELDGALLFLASDASTYVTGQTIAIDGGWVSR